MRMYKCFFALLLIVFLSSCSTIITGTSQRVNISSDPSEATVTITNINTNMLVFNGVTPSSVNLNKGDGYFKGAAYRIDIKKDGYTTQSIQVFASMTGWYIAGNILLGGLIGWLIVDPISGGMWALSPENVSVNLQKSFSWYDSGSSIKIVLKSSIPDQVFDQLSLERLQ